MALESTAIQVLQFFAIRNLICGHSIGLPGHAMEYHKLANHIERNRLRRNAYSNARNGTQTDDHSLRTAEDSKLPRKTGRYYKSYRTSRIMFSTSQQVNGGYERAV